MTKASIMVIALQVVYIALVTPGGTMRRCCCFCLYRCSLIYLVCACKSHHGEAGIAAAGPIGAARWDNQYYILFYGTATMNLLATHWLENLKKETSKNSTQLTGFTGSPTSSSLSFPTMIITKYSENMVDLMALPSMDGFWMKAL